ncbi:MAG: UDP-N-acetylmuramoyl-tripeptide--D-alanyl-D-alanine ligase [Bacteroidaceae bacterium]|nr:UDP-N-acetylmuramoyl-tripeptide--D-alanyl-D-alanine ligase [Bacteroidaceae bacterium]MBR6857194.1 UDP-N-acetylmuramoyl-tripeptide--D-alanyl-D-alanine ligase [Bacteroidaceae bacterium]
MTVKEIYSIFQKCTGVTTDSRKCGPGLMFFALKGERFDGNEFVRGALEQGCPYAVMDNAGLYDAQDSRMILVDNVLSTLQQVAALHRRTLGTPVIGITGTNGKTTTKELTNAVMSTTYNVLCTQGNLNNSIGVPLTVLGLKPEHEYAIVEMGASHPGDIKELVEVSQPDFGLITNVGKAHLLGFGSFEGVKRTKGELYDWLREHDGTAFVNRDNEHLQQMCKGLPLIEYGKPGHDGLLVEGEVLECNPFVKFRWRSGKGEWHTVQTSLIGAYNVDNALAAITIGLKFGVKEQDASEAVADYKPQNNRSQLTETGRNSLVVDAYNANPTSMAAALENFSMIKAQDKMLILGDMRELGEASDAEHRKIVEEIAKYGFTQVWLVGSEFAKAADGSGFRLFADVDEVNKALESEKIAGKTILIKGSNSIGLTKTITNL